MKVCQINCIYGSGSTGKIVKDVHNTLVDNGIESIVIAPVMPSDCKYERGVYCVSSYILNRTSAIYRRLTGRQFDGGIIETNRILNILKREKPDIVHLHCINGNNINVYRLYDYLSKNHIKTILTLHANFPFTGGCGHSYDCEQWVTGCKKCPILKEATHSWFFDGTARTWRKQMACYQKFETGNLYITAVSPWLLERCKRSPMLSRFKSCVVMNGVDASIFKPRVSNWREKLGILDSEKMLFYATASFNPYEENLKGGKYIVRLAEILKDQSYKIVVAANYGKVGELPSNVIYLGRTKTQIELAELYSAADLSIITSKLETFSMPVAESLCCGTPIVGFEAGGPESIALKEFSEFVEYGNTDALASVVERWIHKKDEKEVISQSAQNVYSKEAMTNNFMDLYKEREM